LLAVALALLGGLLLFRGLWRLRRRRFLAAGTHGVLATMMLAVGGVLIAISSNLYTYQRLSWERPVAEVQFRRLGPQRFQATLTYAGNQGTVRHVLKGDDWQIDARILKWRGVANLLGLDAEYRLERLSGRYNRIGQARTGPRTVYDLSNSSGVDVWSLARRYGTWFPWVDALYGSATYLPMANDASFQVSITQSGLVARPLNDVARRAVGNWR